MVIIYRYFVILSIIYNDYIMTGEIRHKSNKSKPHSTQAGT